MPVWLRKEKKNRLVEISVPRGERERRKNKTKNKMAGCLAMWVSSQSTCAASPERLLCNRVVKVVQPNKEARWAATLAADGHSGPNQDVDRWSGAVCLSS